MSLKPNWLKMLKMLKMLNMWNGCAGYTRCVRLHRGMLWQKRQYCRVLWLIRAPVCALMVPFSTRVAYVAPCIRFCKHFASTMTRARPVLSTLKCAEGTSSPISELGNAVTTAGVLCTSAIVCKRPVLHSLLQNEIPISRASPFCFLSLT